MNGSLQYFVLACIPLTAIAVERRPNIIVIVTDDQRNDALGVVQREQGVPARYPFFQTPNLDRLAAEGAQVFGVAAGPYELRNLVAEPVAAVFVTDPRARSDALKRRAGTRGNFQQP